MTWIGIALSILATVVFWPVLYNAGRRAGLAAWKELDPHQQQLRKCEAGQHDPEVTSFTWSRTPPAHWQAPGGMYYMVDEEENGGKPCWRGVVVRREDDEKSRIFARTCRCCGATLPLTEGQLAIWEADHQLLREEGIA